MKHALVYSQLPFVDLAAVCDTNKNTVHNAAEQLGVQGFDNLDKFLERDDIDAVSIAVPDHIHLNPLKKAIEAKKHILIEKPIASTLEDAYLAQEMLKGYDRVFGVAHLLRFDPRFVEVKKAITNGELGDILSMSFRRNSSIEGGRHYGRFAGVHIHVMIHDIDLAHWFIGAKPSSVFARSRSVTLRELGTEDIVFATVEYDNGVLANFEACWTLPASIPFELHDTAEVIGTHGAAYIDSCACGVSIVGRSRTMSPDSRHWPEIGDNIGGALQQEIIKFLCCITDNRPFPVSIEASLESVRVTEAITRSLRARKEITIES